MRFQNDAFLLFVKVSGSQYFDNPIIIGNFYICFDLYKKLNIKKFHGITYLLYQRPNLILQLSYQMQCILIFPPSSNPNSPLP